MDAHVTIVLPTHNSRIFLDQCLQSLTRLDYPQYDLLAVDDGSSDDTVGYLHQHYPQVRVIQLPKQSGHSKACNTGILGTDARYVYIVEHHTIVTPDALSRLMDVILADEKAAICYSRQINMYNDQLVVVEGKRNAHYAVNQQCDRQVLNADRWCEDARPVDVTSAGTFSYLIDKEKFQTLDYFDEDYFIHINDYELTLRTKAAGWKCYYVPDSVTYHRSFVQTASSYNFRGGRTYPAFRTFYISRNRWLLMLSYYEVKTLLLLGPALLIYEILTIIFAMRRGVFGAYLKAMGWLCAHPGMILKKRRTIQRLKKVKDSALLVAGELNFVPGLTRSPLEHVGIRYLTKFLTTYWKIVKPVLS